jgi:predicted NAD/FAD-dependent oxidoreductase
VDERSVLVIGAGMTGLTAARLLQEQGVGSVLLDKGQRPGGRMASRSIGEARFDHGAQHFGIRDPEFRQIANEWMSAGIVQEWFHATTPNPDGTPNVRHSARGGIRSIAEFMAGGLDLRTSSTATRLHVAPDGVTAVGGDGDLAHGSAVIITAPIPQTLELLDASALPPPDRLRLQLAGIEYDACLAAMARLDGPAGLPAGHLTPDAGPIAWIGDNQHKGVSMVPAITIHSSPAFAATNIEAAIDEWVKTLCDASAPMLSSRIMDATGHRWRYAEPRTTLETGAASYREGVPIVLAGEAFAGARIEGAFLSGREAARQLLEMM